MVFDLNEGNFGIRKISGSKNGRQCLRKNQKEKSIHKYKNKSIFTELEHYGEILEKHFHDMMDVEFTVENGKLYILSARIGKRSKLANLKIVMSMFCEGKMSVEDVIKKIPYQQIEDLLDEEKLVNADGVEG